MGLAGDGVRVVSLRFANLGKTHLLAEDAPHRLVDDAYGHLPAFDQALEPFAIVPGEGHLDIQPAQRGRPAVMDGEHKIGQHKAVKAPFALEDIAQQIGMVGAPLTVDTVVGAHDRGHPFVDAAPKVGQIDLAQRALVDAHVDLEPRVFDAVEGIVFGAGHDVALHAAHQGGPHLAQVVGILAKGLLGAAPGGMPQQVDAHPAKVVGAQGARFNADGVADALLQVDVPRRAAGHGHRKAGGMVHDHAAGPIAEADAGDAQPGVLAGVDGTKVVGAHHFEPVAERAGIARHLVDLVGQGHLGQQLVDPGLDPAARQGTVCGQRPPLAVYQLLRHVLLVSCDRLNPRFSPPRGQARASRGSTAVSQARSAAAGWRRPRAR